MSSGPVISLFGSRSPREMATNGGNSALQKWVLGVSGSVATAAILFGAGFSFSTSKEVAVMSREIRDLAELRVRVRTLELEIAVLKAAHINERK